MKVPGTQFTDEQLASFTALSDVMCTGYHAAVSAGVQSGSTVAVVGDGAVGLSGVLAARLLGAGRIIALSRNPARQLVAREFGATDIVEQRGQDAVESVLKFTDAPESTPLAGRINPGRVFDLETDLDSVAEAYAAMDERRAIKSLLRISEV